MHTYKNYIFCHFVSIDNQHGVIIVYNLYRTPIAFISDIHTITI
ncbi:hypothetical protein AB162_103 [Candidatus Palibaumannia cicadellinicola]|uniref:Uncharacterized protein n=1 Tax=Candidatus Palibaumannia cicadellinicola TaxID=186490 RepID=A0A0K2BKI5_9GAMM|nr:hypothetical protein AB162_103 [Candidatus Baumannia cicadellinicola]